MYQLTTRFSAQIWSWEGQGIAPRMDIMVEEEQVYRATYFQCFTPHQIVPTHMGMNILAGIPPPPHLHVEAPPMADPILLEEGAPINLQAQLNTAQVKLFWVEQCNFHLIDERDQLSVCLATREDTIASGAGSSSGPEAV